MKQKLVWLVGAFFAFPLLAQDIVINEIMYHPASQGVVEEYIELHNRGTVGLDLVGWRFTRGVRFTFPSGSIIQPGSYLVVAADLATFQTHYPGVPNVVGNWEGTLANGGETIELQDATGATVDLVDYADAGDWGVRRRGPIDRNSRGWEWFSPADPDLGQAGASLELINPRFFNEHGQNWGTSLVPTGSPGGQNSIRRFDIAPVILDVEHFPVIPTAADEVTVRCRVLDEDPSYALVRLSLFHRTLNGAFMEMPMLDDGLHNDGLAGDRVYGAILPPQPNNTVVEYYIFSNDGDHQRTWPAAALNEFGVAVQMANMLYQVDETIYSGSQMLFRLVMTVAEEQELRFINRDSDAEMNATLITIDGARTEVRHNVGVRIRGAGSRGAAVPNYRVSIPGDKPWNGVDALNVNAQYGHAQVAGAAIVLKGGLPASNARPIQVRVNGVNFASAGAVNGFGSYALVEVVNGDWAESHLPADPDGNVYIARRPNTDLTYLGNSPQNYISQGYDKGSNSSENDWTDLFDLTFVLDQSPANTFSSEFRRVANVEEWMTYFAFNTLLGNGETALGTGVGDDYDLYRGVVDPRFIVVQHDLDTILAQGQGPAGVTADIFRAAALPVVSRFLPQPEFVPLYYRELKRAIDGVLSRGQLEPLLDRVLGEYVPAQTIAQMKQYAIDRNAYVLSQIPLNFNASTGLPVVSGFPRTTFANISVSGQANAIETRSVEVNGVPGSWNPLNGFWSVNSVALNPGLNRVSVRALDEQGAEVDSVLLQVWYDDGSTVPVAGTLTGNTTWSAAPGPYVVSGVVRVPAGVTLTIGAGTTVYFGQGAGLLIEGRLVAEGTGLNRIHLTRQPGTSVTWGGIDFDGSDTDNRITHADIAFADTDDPLELVDSRLFVDDVIFSGTGRTLIELDNSSIEVRNSVFPDLGGQEHIHGGPMPPGGHVIIEGNLFGTTTGLNDIIDFTGAQRPGPVVQILNNVFTAASDDVLDLDGTDAHVEGNLFMRVHNGNFAAEDTASAISFGADSGYGPTIVAVRNFFYDVDHVALVKEGGFLSLENNTGLGIGVAVVNFSEPERNTVPGAGAYLDGNVFWNPPGYQGTNFQNRFPTNGTVQLTVHRSYLPGSDGLTNGMGNLNLDPLLFNADTNTIASIDDVRAALKLLPGSPAAGTGPNGLDRGADVPAGASITGEPSLNTSATSATLKVAGPGIVAYRYEVNGGGTSAETSVTNPILLTGLSDGVHTVAVYGRNSAGVEQAVPAQSKTWTVSAGVQRIVINEVLALNESLGHEDTFPDQVELYNPGAEVVQLGGMGLSDDPSDPYRFRFPAGTALEPGQYLVVYADAEAASGLHTGFGLSQTGDSVLLYGTPQTGGVLLDSVVFGLQLPDLSIGRRQDGSWTLNRPTLGGPNEELATGLQTTLRINEWLTDGVSLFQEDFLEIYNPQPVPVALGGLFLSDEPLGHPTDHEMAALSYIGAFQHLVLIPDGDLDAGANHLDFRLTPEGGRIGLAAADLTMIDCVSYGQQMSDVSEGRRPSGSDAISLFGPVTGTTPTPGAPNPGAGGASTVTNIVIPILDLASNWRYERNGLNLGTVWRETGFDDSSWPVGAALLGDEGSALPPPGLQTDFPNYNQSQITYYFRTRFTVSQDLTGFQLVANTVFDDGGVIYINGTEVLRVRMPGGTITSGTQALEPTVNNASLESWVIPSGSLVMGDNVLAVEIHQAGIPSSDIVMGMGLEGRRSITNTPARLVLNEILARNANVVAPGDTNITDWIELHNPSDDAVDLAGKSLSDDLLQPRRWVFPAGSSIPAGGYLVVRADGGSPASTVAGSVLNTGFGLSAGGDSVYLFDSPGGGGALLDSINFGLQAEDFSIGRIPNVTGPWVLTLATPGAVNLRSSLGVATDLTINEWLARPSGNDDDYFELYNPNPQPVSIGGLFLSDDLTDRTKHKIGVLSFVGVGESAFALFLADGNPENGADHVDFGLSAGGESIGLFQANGVEIDSVTFGGQANGVSEGRFPDGSESIHRFDGTTTPGASNIIPLEDIVINEVLAHTDDPYEDAIELFNPTERSVDISGWYLSDSRANPKKFRIPDGVIVEPGGYAVFYEYQFNPDFTGRFPGFALSSVEGDDVVLSTADAAGNLTGFRGRADFDASEQFVPFGRYETSVETHFVSLRATTFGADAPATTGEFRTGGGLPNALPKVGPVVISEIMYHPRDAGTNDNLLDEYIELHNITGAAVDLFDTAFPTNTWRLRDAVDFEFPMGVTLPPDGRLILLSFDPSTNAVLVLAMQIKFGLPPGTVLMGPWRGALNNSSDSVELYKPDSPQPIGTSDAGFVPYVLVDAVEYEDGAPWPSAADGPTDVFGYSLQRRVPADYGNDPVNWLAGAPTMGEPTGPALAELPSLTLQPAGQSVAAGGTIVLNSMATGSGVLVYQWRFNGRDIPGAVSATLTIPGASLDNGGAYRVRVNNEVGAVLSEVATVTVEAAPEILQQPRTLAVVAGQTARFTVGAAGTRPLAYQWFLEGSVLPGETNSSLVVVDVQMINEGNYTVEVTNAFGSVTSEGAGLFINSPPSIVEHPQGTNVFVGSNVAFSVTVAGSPPLTYQWRRNGLPLALQTNSTLVFTAVQLSDSAEYTVQVFNPVGAVTSDGAQLTVLIPPTITIEVVDGVASEPGVGDTAEFRLRRAGSTNTAVLVNLVVSGNATPGLDYVTLVSPVLIPAGAAAVSILVTVIDDMETEGDETVQVNVAAGAGYLVGQANVAAVVIRDEDNSPPVVSISAPTDGEQFDEPANVLITVSATDPDGSIVRVDFLADGTNVIGQRTGQPYQVTWFNVPGGDHVLTAVAVDNLGSSTVSAPVSIRVNSSPQITLISPLDGASFEEPADITLTALAGDPGGAVTLVEFFDGGTLVGTSTAEADPALRADYLFENTRASSVAGAPALADLGPNVFATRVVDGESRTVLRFAANDGLRLDPAASILPNDAYTVVMLFSFDTVSAFRRILEFKDGGSDDGLYSLDGTLYLYPQDLGPGPTIGPGNFVQVVLTRDSAANVTGYVDGVQQFGFVDGGGLASLVGSSGLQFFRDDGSEGAAGSVARIRVYDRALSQTEILALDRLPGGGGSGGVFSLTLNNVALGSHTYTARATDDLGATATSQAVTVFVNPAMSNLDDFFAGRGGISGVTNFVIGNNIGYSRELGEPRHDNRNGGRSAWISWTAPLPGLCVMDTFGSGFDTVLAVYLGESVDALVRIASNDDYGGSQSRVAFNVLAGVSYQVVVDGFGPNDSGTISLQLNLETLAPTITSHPAGATVNPGAPVTFGVVAIGGAPLSYQWRYNGVEIPGADEESFTLSNVQGADSGEYTVVVSNSRGSVTSDPALLVVRVPPTVTGQPVAVVADPGGSAMFSATAQGTPPLTYQWRVNGMIIPGATSSSLSLIDVGHAQGGSYQVIVGNSLGSTISQPARLIVRPVMTRALRLLSGAVEVAFDGVPNQAHVVEVMVDGGPWTDAGSVTSPSVGAQYVDGNAGGNEVRLYRARVVP